MNTPPIGFKPVKYFLRKNIVSTPRNLLDFFVANGGMVRPGDKKYLAEINSFDLSALGEQVRCFLNEIGNQGAKYRVVLPADIYLGQIKDVFAAPGLPDLVFDPEKREVRVELTSISRLAGCQVIGDRAVIDNIFITAQVGKALSASGLIIVGHDAPLDVFESQDMVEIVDGGPLVLGTRFKGLESETRKYVVQHLEPSVYDVVRDLAEINDVFAGVLTVMRDKVCKDVLSGHAKTGHKEIIERMMADRERPYPFKDNLNRFESYVLGAVAESVRKKSDLPTKTESYECARLVYNAYFGVYYNKIRECLAAGDYQAAYQAYQQAGEAYPAKKGLGDELAIILLKEALEIKEDNRVKTEKLEAALMFSPNNKKILAPLCACYTNTGNYDRAIECGLAVGHQDPIICLALGISYVARCREKGFPDEADLRAAETNLFAAIRRGYTGPQPSYNLAFIYIIKGELEKAVEQIKIRYGKDQGMEAVFGLLLAIACSKKMHELAIKNEKSLVSFINSLAVDQTNVPTLTQLAILYDYYGFKDSAGAIIEKLRSLQIDEVVRYVQAVILINKSERSGDKNVLPEAVNLLRPLALAKSEGQVFSREKNDFCRLGNCAAFYYLQALDKIDPAQAEAALPEMQALYPADSEVAPT